MMQMIQSFFQNSSDRKSLLVRDPLHFYGLMATLFGLLSDSDNDALFCRSMDTISPSVSE